jgi:two-component system NtrC family response regulator
LERYRTTSNSTIENLSPEAMEVLQNYEWPGNVRELQNVIENLAVMVNRPLIQIEDLPTQIRVNQLQKSVLERQSKDGVNLEAIVATFEKQLIEEALRKCNGIFTRAARLLGTTRRILKYRIDKLDLQVERRHGRPRKSLGQISDIISQPSK